MSDAIAPFFDKNKKIEHYSNIPFYQLDLYGKKDLVDFKQLDESKKRFEKYCKLLKENGYNSLSLDDLNHLTIFEKSQIYKNSDIGKRNKIYLKYYKELVKIARKNNLKVYITTDMQFYTTLLEKKIGKIDENNKKLEDLNKQAFEELFQYMPEVEGVIIRIGEGGKAYNSGEYKSKIIYKTPKQVNTLLKDLLPIFEKYNKKLIFRTWTIGIGKIGDLITNKETYDKTFKGIKSKNLIVSIKHTPGDFFWFDKLNPTIGYGNLKQIVEIQIRKEYEGGGDFPNYIGEYYLELIKKIKNKKNVIGVWNWNQTGGWGWGKHILFNFGFNFYNEINFFAVGEILKSGEKVENEDILKKVLNKYNFNKTEKEILYKIFKNSRNIIKKGWYIDDFRKKELKIGGIYVPSLSRIWWDKVTSSPIILSLIYNCLDTKFETIEESSYLLGIQKEELELWKKNTRKNEFNQKITESLENRYKIFEILHIFKKAFILYFQTGEKKYYDVLDKKIKEYNNFAKNKTQFHFDFSEIYKFYGKNDFSYWIKNISIFLNLLSLTILIFFTLNYSKLKKYYKQNNKNRILIGGALILNILLLTITPFFFLSEYNFYWLLIKINYLLMSLIIIYFIILSQVLNKIYKIKIKLKRGFGKLICIFVPILFVLEFTIIISYLFGEQFFWKFLTLAIFKENIKIFIILLFIIYFSIFVYYGFRFSNIHKFLQNIKYKKTIYTSFFIFLIIFLIFIFSLDYSKIFFKNIIKNIIPIYFQSAGSDVREFF